MPFLHDNAKLRLAPIALSLSLALSSYTLAADDEVISIEIPAQSLSSAVNELALQTGLNIGGNAALLKSKQARPLTGEFTSEQALQKLLEGSGISYRFVDANTVTLEPTSDNSSVGNESSVQQLDTLTVFSKNYVVDDSNAATKTDTLLEEIPQSITIINSDLLDSWNAGKLTEALRYTPGVQAEPFGIEPRFTNLRIRGFNAQLDGFYRDGLVLRNTPNFIVSYNLETFGAERIEIPRGPSSVLFGQGSPGGFVNYVSKRPTDEVLREVEVEVGNFDRKQVQFDFGGPVNDKFSYRLTGVVRDADTQIDFVEEDRVYIAPTFRWQPNDDTTFTFLSSFQQDDTKNSQALPAPGTLFPNPNGSIPINRFTGEPDVDEVDRTEFYLGYILDHTVNEKLSLRQNFRYNNVDLDDVVVFSNGIENDQRTINRGAFANFGSLSGFTIDNQALINFGNENLSHQLLIGLDFQDLSGDQTQSFGTAPDIDIFDPVFGQAVVLPAPFRDDEVDLTQLGIYVQDQIKFDEKWVLTLGARFDDASNETRSRLTNTTADVDDNELTYRAGLNYLFGNGWAPYISYAESFRASAGADANGDPFDPEFGKQIELGVKYQPDHGITTFSAALFNLERENFTETNPSTFLSVQTGEARSRGLELEVVGNFDTGLDLYANYTYLDTEITESVVATEIGNRLPQIPEHIASVWADYSFQNGPLKGFGLAGGVRFQTGNFSDTANSFESSSFAVADAAIHYDWKNFRFAINAQNLFDREIISSCFPRSGADFCTFGEARTVRATIKYKL